MMELNVVEDCRPKLGSIVFEVMCKCLKMVWSEMRGFRAI